MLFNCFFSVAIDRSRFKGQIWFMIRFGFDQKGFMIRFGFVKDYNSYMCMHARMKNYTMYMAMYVQANSTEKKRYKKGLKQNGY